MEEIDEIDFFLCFYEGYLAHLKFSVHTTLQSFMANLNAFTWTFQFRGKTEICHKPSSVAHASSSDSLLSETAQCFPFLNSRKDKGLQFRKQWKVEWKRWRHQLEVLSMCAFRKDAKHIVLSKPYASSKMFSSTKRYNTVICRSICCHAAAAMLGFTENYNDNKNSADIEDTTATNAGNKRNGIFLCFKKHICQLVNNQQEILCLTSLFAPIKYVIVF